MNDPSVVFSPAVFISNAAAAFGKGNNCQALLKWRCTLFVFLIAYTPACARADKRCLACSAEHGCLPADWQDISTDNEHSWSCEGLDADWPLSPDVRLASDSTKLGGLLYSIPGSVYVQLQETSIHEEGTACGI
jgi:hypothetical protein